VRLRATGRTGSSDSTCGVPRTRDAGARCSACSGRLVSLRDGQAPSPRRPREEERAHDQDPEQPDDHGHRRRIVPRTACRRRSGCSRRRTGRRRHCPTSPGPTPSTPQVRSAVSHSILPWTRSSLRRNAPESSEVRPRRRRSSEARPARRRAWRSLHDPGISGRAQAQCDRDERAAQPPLADRGGCVPPPCSDHLERAHHVVLLVLEDVAVPDVLRVREPRRELDGPVGRQVERGADPGHLARMRLSIPPCVVDRSDLPPRRNAKQREDYGTRLGTGSVG
jgi:hypothetical protein